ncbi:MAG TPA: GAF domain-containing sensor histidine kinase [Anaerolineales bacterium]|nr:GAF domain-containing sensor histidine kinase [Anaerolineales bacterium]
MKASLASTLTQEQDIADAARRADILQRVMTLISSGLALDPLLNNILMSAMELIKATHGTIGLVVERNGELMIRTVAAHNMPKEEMGAEMPIGSGLAGAVLKKGKTIILDRYGDLENPTLSEMSEHSVIGVPIRWGEQMIGFFGIGTNLPHRFDQHDATSLEYFSQYASVAIHNANLFNANQRALDEMRLLYETSQRIGISDDVNGVVDAYLNQVAAGGIYVCNIVLYEFNEHAERTGIIVMGQWSPQSGLVRLHERLPYIQDNLDPILDTGQTITISDIRSDPIVPPSLREIQEESGRWALAMIPLMVRNQRIGLVVLSHPGVHKWSEENLSPYQAVAAQLAIAIDHRAQQTLLQERGQQLAVLQERQRLARELHDSVTQLIFSTTLVAQSIAPAWKRDPFEGEKRVQRLLELSQTALREMRSLLFELKPAEEMEADDLPNTLTGLERIRRYGLLGALRLLVRDFSQEGIQLQMNVDGDGQKSLGSESKKTSGRKPVFDESIYRIVQEALNNAIKHAKAGRISIRLGYDNTNEIVYLSVRDDGTGFTSQNLEKKNSPKGSGLGMKTMRERAETLGGTLRIDSQPGTGTTIEVKIPLKEIRV